MRVPLEWLHEYCSPELDTFTLAERLAMTGTEVERVERHGVTALENFVVGRVLEAKQHPDADRLSVCRVDVGDGEPRQIVCGAPNVAAGQTVASALDDVTAEPRDVSAAHRDVTAEPRDVVEPHPALTTPLEDGELEIVGRLATASNATFHSRVAVSTCSNRRAFTTATATWSASRCSTRASSSLKSSSRLSATSTPIGPDATATLRYAR